MTNQEDSQGVINVNNEGAKKDWENKISNFKDWLSEKIDMLMESTGSNFANFWLRSRGEFFDKAKDVTGLSDSRIRDYAIIQIIIGGTPVYDRQPDFDLPNGEIERLFKEFLGQKMVDIGEEGLL